MYGGSTIGFRRGSVEAKCIRRKFWRRRKLLNACCVPGVMLGIECTVLNTGGIQPSWNIQFSGTDFSTYLTVVKSKQTHMELQLAIHSLREQEHGSRRENKKGRHLLQTGWSEKAAPGRQ